MNLELFDRIVANYLISFPNAEVMYFESHIHDWGFEALGAHGSCGFKIACLLNGNWKVNSGGLWGYGDTLEAAVQDWRHEESLFSVAA